MNPRLPAGRNRCLFVAMASVVAFTTWAGSPSAARACGGFFCDAGAPVNQAAERIVFSRNADGTVTAVVQILYSGPAERFAWVLPVPGTPDVEISSNVAFQRLQSATNPNYQLTTEIEGECASDLLLAAPRAAAEGAGADAGSSDPEDSGVTVVDSGTVGPFDFVTLSLDASAPDPADVAVSWLQDNNYDVDELGRERLGPYLEQGMNLIAFRLSKGNDAGSIRPIRLTYESARPMIPIRPTAVAATDDMGVLVWVLGEHRAIPHNYRSLELNEALINWFNPNTNYNDVVTQAADEGGGQGFVTEQAGPSSELENTVFGPGESAQWAELTSQSWEGRHGELLVRTLSAYQGWDGVRETLEAYLPLPPGENLDDVLNCPFCYYDSEMPTIAGFEPRPYLESLFQNAIEPMEATQALLDSRPYVTRLYTTMSASEMTMDPEFDFNADLEDYSNVHMATRVIECSPALTVAEAPWRVELPQGGIVRGIGTTWPFALGDADPQPAVRRVLQVGTSGTGDVVEDNVASITAALSEHNATVLPPVTSAAGGGGCAAAPLTRRQAEKLGWLALALLVTAAITFRRRAS